MLNQLHTQFNAIMSFYFYCGGGMDVCRNVCLRAHTSMHIYLRSRGLQHGASSSALFFSFLLNLQLTNCLVQMASELQGSTYLTSTADYCTWLFHGYWECLYVILLYNSLRSLSIIYVGVGSIHFSTPVLFLLMSSFRELVGIALIY